jgi:hypothetical protein
MVARSKARALPATRQAVQTVCGVASLCDSGADRGNETMIDQPSITILFDDVDCRLMKTVLLNGRTDRETATLQELANTMLKALPAQAGHMEEPQP